MRSAGKYLLAELNFRLNHATCGRHAVAASVRWFVCHDRLGGDPKTRDRCGVFQRCADDLGCVDDIRLQHIAVLLRLCVVAKRFACVPNDLFSDHGSIGSGIFCNLAQQCLECLEDDRNTSRLIRMVALELVKDFAYAHQCHAASRHNTFLNGRACSV